MLLIIEIETNWKINQYFLRLKSITKIINAKNDCWILLTETIKNLYNIFLFL